MKSNLIFILFLMPILCFGQIVIGQTFGTKNGISTHQKVLGKNEISTFVKKQNVPIISPTGFITEWVVSGADDDGRAVQLPIYDDGSSPTFDFTVTWGDGTSNHITAWNDANATHTYLADGTYDIEIRGECPIWLIGHINDDGDPDYPDYMEITKVISWGDITLFGGFSSLNNAFSGCDNLISISDHILIKTTCTNFYNTFGECTSLTAIPSGLFQYDTAITDFSYVFSGCTSLTTIPADLFRYNTAVTSFNGCFHHLDALTIIPTGLFNYNIAVTNFSSVFDYDISLTTVPTDLFRYNINVTNFTAVLSSCDALVAIPTDLFRYNINVTNFWVAFDRDISLVTVPSDLFRYNTAVTDFHNTFNYCTSLTSIPSDLFRYNTLVTTFYQTFYGCTKLQLNANIFYETGGQTTRFLNKSVVFTDCFNRTSFTGTQGTAPDLWNCSFGTGTATTTGCYGGAGNSATSLSNYASIPSGWK